MSATTLLTRQLNRRLVRNVKPPPQPAPGDKPGFEHDFVVVPLRLSLHQAVGDEGTMVVMSITTIA